MTEKKPLREQIASHNYKRPVSSPAAQPPDRRRSSVAHEGGAASAARNAGTQRVVRMPEAEPQTAWNDYAERRNRRYAARTQSRSATHMVPRTFAQTGEHPTSGRMRAIKRLPQQGHSPIPARSSGSGQRKARRGFLWKVLGIFALLALVLFGAVFALVGPVFRIKQVSISGVHNASLMRTIQQMGMQGQNIFLVNVDALTGRIDGLPMVANATLAKQWPDQMVITVTERTPVLLWQTQQGVYSVDKEGIVIAPASETSGATGTTQLPKVVDTRKEDNSAGRGGSTTGIRPGTRLNAADIAFAMQVFARLPRMTGVTNYTLRYADVLPLHTEAMGASGAFEVVSQAGWMAYLGGSNDINPLDNRLIELQQILALAQQQQLNVATIDLRYGLRPVYTLKS